MLSLWSRKKLVAVVFGCLLVAGCKTAKSSTTADVPAFEGKDLSGHVISLASLRGHPVLLDFWATWCEPCRLSTPVVEAFYKSHKAEGLQVIGVNMDDDPSGVYGFVKEFKMQYPVVLGAATSIGSDFRVEGLPSFILINPEGKVVQRFEGFSEDIPQMWEAELHKMTTAS